MGKVYTTSEDLTSVADAIRAKTGSNAAITYPTGFVNAIGNISTSSGPQVVEPKDVNFIDYDGTFLYSYTRTEAQALTALPDNPSHERFTSQGWNWSLAEIKEQLNADPNQPIIVGQMYVPASGATEIDIVLEDPNYLSPYVFFKQAGQVEINWGDNTIETVTYTQNQNKYYLHTYNNTGNYTIKLKVISGTITLVNGSNDSVGILRPGSNTNIHDRNATYNNAIRGVYIGLNTNIGYYLFAKSYYIEYITIPNTITSIPMYNFYYCYSLKSIIIPNSVTTINSYAFTRCQKLNIVSFPHTLTTLNTYNMFQDCRSLKYITISNLLNDIGTSNSSFYSTNNLQYISPLLLNQMTSIPNSTFNESGLKTITIPSSITTIGNSAFNACYNLQYITMSNNVTTLGSYVFSACQSLVTVILSNQITTIPGSAFSSCVSLRYINIPDSVTTIESSAFYYCTSLTSITIPQNVTDIGNGAFNSCYGLIEYHFKPTTPPTLGNNALGNVSLWTLVFKIYVPYSSDHSILEAYKTANNWSTYASYIVEEPAPTE